MKSNTIAVFNTRLGWMAVVTAGTTVKQLTFGHKTAAAAKASLDPAALAGARPGKDNRLIARLQAYAEGAADDFRDVAIDPGPVGEFERRILDHCRRIGYGRTASYAELAAKAGYRGAARATGNCMAGNRIPLIVPCHRVVRSDGRVGAYSAPGGTETKRKLLALEAAWSRTSRAGLNPGLPR